MRKNKIFIFGTLALIGCCGMLLGNTVIASADEETFDFNSLEMQTKCAQLTQSDDIRQEFSLEEYFTAIKEEKYSTPYYPTTEAAA